MLRPSNSI